MKQKFSIHYRTEWGQQLAVDIVYRSQDGSTRSVHLPMLTADGDFWTAETSVVESRRSPIVSFTYIYKVEDNDGHELRREWNIVDRVYAFDASKSYCFDDQWRDLPLPAHLYTSAYAVTCGMVSDEKVEPLRLPLFRKTILFRVSAPQLLPAQRVAIIGSHPVLGSWSPIHYLPMEYAGQHEWLLTINADALQMPFDYKYVVIDTNTHQLLKWEEGDNRMADSTIADGEVHVLYGSPLRLKEKPWRAAGVCIPVFALRSEQSCGVGDFGDLYHFIDWAASVGMKIVQLLPVNDTTNSHSWSDSHPYNIMSAFKLHPHYIDLNQLPPLKNKHSMTVFHRQQRELNALKHSDYEAVDCVKTAYLKACYEESGTDKSFEQYVQDHLHQQLKRAADHARSLGVMLMGDLPIGVSGDSIDVKEHPNLFHLDCSAGTPPDAFTPQGQNWGFPTYNWEQQESKASAADSPLSPLEAWMGDRLKWMEQYFDAVRIDHVLGFFRIWEIPSDQLFGTMGHFTPALPLTPDEIDYFGLPFRRDFLTRPFINDRIIDRFFGIHAAYVRDNYLVRKAYGLYGLKEEVSTQRRICDLFDGRGDENSLWIRDGLYRLVSNVLFVEDHRRADMYHPRIQAFSEPVYESLSSEEKDAYMRIYNNYFYQRHNMFWGKTGYDRLSAMLRSTHMLVCGEDLGMMPDCVAPVLDSLRILTLEIQQMPKQNGMEFTHLDGNPVRSLATISTHDMAPLRQWWQENPERTQRYYTTMLQKQGKAPEQLPAHLAEEIIARHLYCPSMLCVLSLQDWLAMDSELRNKNPREERVNAPADPYNRWQWRMHLPIDQLEHAERFNQKLKTMISRSHR